MPALAEMKKCHSARVWMSALAAESMESLSICIRSLLIHLTKPILTPGPRENADIDETSQADRGPVGVGLRPSLNDSR